MGVWGALLIKNAPLLTTHHTNKQQNKKQKKVPSPTTPGANVTLRDVCFRPFEGGACATQSLTQYWRNDAAFYASEQTKGPFSTKLTPDYCLTHWTTQCRADFGAPVDPHVVLGGFPTDSTFRSYRQDAASLVVTFPLSSAPEDAAAAAAWEAAFLRLAGGKLAQMAAEANLTLAYSAERYVVVFLFFVLFVWFGGSCVFASPLQNTLHPLTASTNSDPFQIKSKPKQPKNKGRCRTS